MLTERLEIRLDSETMRRLRAAARRRDVSVAHIVRDAIGRAVDAESAGRLAAAEQLFGIEAPVSDWELMEAEIVRGRLDPVNDDLS